MNNNVPFFIIRSKAKPDAFFSRLNYDDQFVYTVEEATKWGTLADALDYHKNIVGNQHLEIVEVKIHQEYIFTVQEHITPVQAVLSKLSGDDIEILKNAGLDVELHRPKQPRDIHVYEGFSCDIAAFQRILYDVSKDAKKFPKLADAVDDVKFGNALSKLNWCIDEDGDFRVSDNWNNWEFWRGVPTHRECFEFIIDDLIIAYIDKSGVFYNEK